MGMIKLTETIITKCITSSLIFFAFKIFAFISYIEIMYTVLSTTLYYHIDLRNGISIMNVKEKLY